MSKADTISAQTLRKADAKQDRPRQILSARMEPSKDPRDDDDHHDGRRTDDLVDQESGRAGDTRNRSHPDGRVQVRGKEDEAQHGEEQRVPDRLQHDKREREHQRDREQHQDDPRAGPEVRLQHLARLVQPFKTRIDEEEHPDEEEPHQRPGHLGHVQEEAVRDLTHGPKPTDVEAGSFPPDCFACSPSLESSGGGSQRPEERADLLGEEISSMGDDRREPAS
jgi:hypothetical protein